MANPYETIFQRVCEIIEDVVDDDFTCKELAELCETTPRQIGAAFKNDQFIASLFERGFLVDVVPDYGWKAEGRQTMIGICRAE